MSATSATKSVRSCDAQSVMYSFVHTARIQKARSSDSRKCGCQHGWPSDVDDNKEDFQSGTLKVDPCACQPSETKYP